MEMEQGTTHPEPEAGVTSKRDYLYSLSFFYKCEIIPKGYFFKKNA